MSTDIELVEDDEAPEIVHIYFPDIAVGTIPEMSAEERRTYIGGSDAAKALNESKHGDSYSLVEEKLGVRPPDDLTNREDVYFGAILESVVRQEYMRRSDNIFGEHRIVRRVPRLIRHPRYPWIGAHLDGIILNSRGALEAKTTKATKIEDWGEPGSDEVPRDYFIQGQHNMAASDRRFMDYPVLFGGQKLLVYTVQRDDKFIEDMIFLEYDNVWKWVERGELPPPETSDEANRRWPISREGEVQASAEVIQSVAELARFKAVEKEAKEAQELMELTIKAALGDTGDTLMAGTRRLCTWKTQSNNRVDLDAIRAAYPEIVAKFTPTDKTSRVLRLTKK